MRHLVLACWVILALATPVLAQPTLRSGDHPGFGRIVVDFGSTVSFHVEQTGSDAKILFGTSDPLPDAAGPRNVLAVRPGAGSLALSLVPGATLRTWRMGTRLVIDVLDPPSTPAKPAERQGGAHHVAAGRQNQGVPPAAGKAAKPPAHAVAHAAGDAGTVPNPAPSAAAAPPPGAAAAAPPAVAAAPPASPQAAPQQPAAIAAGTPAGTIAAGNASAAPMALAAERVVLPDSADPAVLLPFGAATGAAAFHRAGMLIVVFDERRPVDLGALQDDPNFAAARITLLPEATQLQLPDQPARLVAEHGGWVVALGHGQPADPVIPAADGHALRLLMAAPGRSLVVADPETAGNLLVGTQRRPGPAGGPPQGIVVPHQAPAYGLVPTIQGVVVEPLSDQLSLRVASGGFVLEAAHLNLAPSAADADLPALLHAATLTRAFTLPDRSPEALLQMLAEQVSGAASAPPRARRALRLQAAQTMMALGMGVEAQAVLRLAAAEDAEHADDPDLVALSAAAALIAERPAEAAGIDDARLDGNDEIALWRAVLLASGHEGDPAAAAGFAATLPLLLSYPPALRTRLLPMAAETMALGGQRAAAADLVAQLADDPTLVFARALLAESKDTPDAALAAYAALAEGRDRKLRARAGRRAVELRLAAGQLDKAQAADALEKLVYAWRGDEFEVSLRSRIAALRADRQPRAAMALLRETAGLFPGDAAKMRAQRKAIFTAMLQKPDAIPAIELVSAVEENADLVPEVPDNDGLANLLADRLVGLNLPDRAAPILERLMRSSDGVSRARYGARLASVRLGIRDFPGTRTALADSDEPDLPDDLREQRAMLDARALAELGDPRQGAAALAAFSGEAAIRLRASLLGKAGNWPDATDALGHLVDALPATGALSAAQQGLLLDCASAASQAGDETRLHMLATFSDRIDPAQQPLFRMMTEAPIQSTIDLPRAGREIVADQQAIAQGGQTGSR